MAATDQGIGVIWSIPVSERQKYDQIFEGLQPLEGLLTGDKVKPVLLNSKLPVEVLGRVWELSDIDADGFLDREEFTVAMHLVYRALEKNPVPMALPIDMIPPGKRKLPIGGLIPGGGGAIPGGLISGGPGPLADNSVQPLGTISGSKWVINAADKLKYDEMFRQADTTGTGLVNGLQVKDVFLQSGLPQMTLAHIWNLCDTKMCGQLNAEQFALAMHMVQQKRLYGIEPPMQLTPDMMPTSMQQDQGLSTGGFNLTDTVGMKELDKLAVEIEELKRQKMSLEQDKTQKEADIRIRNGEVAALQKELDSMNSMVTQLGTQKEEAQKRLDELDDKRTKLENSVAEIKEKYNEEQRLINEFQNQILSRESIVTNQEVELKRMKEELDRLRKEESELELKLDTSRHQANSLAKRVSDTQAEVNQTNKQVEELKELQQQLSKSVAQYDDLLKGVISEDQLTSIPQHSLVESNTTPQSMANIGNTGDVKSKDSFASLGPLSSGRSSIVGAGVSDVDPFSGHTDPFSSGTNTAFDVDPFNKKSADTAFQDPFGYDSASNVDPFGGDPFADGAMGTMSAESRSPTMPPSETFSIGQDPWGAPKASTLNTAEGGFDAFGFSATSSADKVDGALINSLDPFGTGSFGASNNVLPSYNEATGKSFNSHSSIVSSTPVLPPKQKKAPAPPRPPMPKPSRESPSYRGTDSPQFGMQPAEPSRSKFSSEAEMLAWATLDSKKEFERQKRLQEQEQADLELAIALSKQ